MEKIDEQLNNLKMVDAPIGLHQFVMRKINYKKIAPVLFTALIILMFNFLVIGWHINMKLIDAEFLDMTQDFFEIFTFNFPFFNTVWNSFFEIISPMLLLSAVLSLGGIIYVIKKINSYRVGKM